MHKMAWAGGMFHLKFLTRDIVTIVICDPSPSFIFMEPFYVLIYTATRRVLVKIES